MKKLVMIAAMLSIISPFPVFGQSEGYYSGSYTRLNYVQGDVYIQRAQNLGYEKGEVNLVVITGDKLGTREGRAEIQLGRSNYLRLDRNTVVDIAKLPSGEGDLTNFHLLSGSVYLRVYNLDREKNFQIHTPDASFYVMEPGLFRVDVLENRETRFGADSGSAEAAGEEGSVLIHNGEQVTATNGRFTSSPVMLQSRRDDFSDWNASRDALFAQRPTQRYLADDYSDYESELSNYGRWAYEPSYGNVWVPTISDYDWRPYYYGHWVWYPIIGWTWVSYEPWGWCTSHYGRWGWGLDLGWYWIPYHHWGWGPAWVHWYHGYDYIGWCPLSYWGRPAVFVGNHFYDRYDRDYFPANSRSMTIVRRDQLQSPRLRDVALSHASAEGLGRIQVQASQPDIRPEVNGSRRASSEALKTFSRENMRDVGRGFASGQRQLNAEQIRSSAQRGRIQEQGLAGASSASGSRVFTNRDLERFRSERMIREQSSGPGSSSIQKREGTDQASGIAARQGQKSELRTAGETASGREIRSFPSRSSAEASSSGLRDRSGEAASSRMREFSTPSGQERRSPGSSSIREFRDQGSIKSSSSLRNERPSSSSSSAIRSSAGRESSSERVIRERSISRDASPTQNSQRSVIRERGTTGTASRSSGLSQRYESRSSSQPGSSASSNFRSSRSYAPAYSGSSSSLRNYSPPSQNYSSSSRSYSAPSRSYSSPSRSYSSPSRSYSAPSRSYSSSSRSYSAPSRSSGSSSRSYSAPSRSSSSGSSRSSSSRSSSSGRSARRR